jgi:Protein kinase domain/PEGA domain
VYRAQDTVRDQLVAVKVFKLDAPPEQAEQIADALQAVVQALPRHRGLIELVAAGVERDTAYLVMAHSEVLSLDTRLKPGVPLDVEEALGIILTLADAMDAAHERGIVHGGLHPRDIFVDERSSCRAAGFGVATALARAGVRVPVRRPYSPPERLTSAPIEPTADRFALGAIAFELLTGRRIVGTGATAAARCAAPVAHADADKLQNALAAMLAEQPSYRPSSASAFAQALTLALFPRGIASASGPRSAADRSADKRSSGASSEDTQIAAVGAVSGPVPSGRSADEGDGPSPDDLERFTRQGMLWEAKPREGEIRWETVETVALGQDPLALFAPESPPADGTSGKAAAHATDADDVEAKSASTRSADVAAVASAAAAAGVSRPLSSPIPSDRAETARPGSILGLSSPPMLEPASLPEVDRLTHPDATLDLRESQRARDAGVAARRQVDRSGEEAVDDDESGDAEPIRSAMLLRPLDREDVSERAAPSTSAPFFDDASPDGAVAFRDDGGSAASSRSGVSPRDAHDGYGWRERDEPPAYAVAPTRVAPVGGTAPVDNALLAPPEPTDVGSSVRVVGLVLALGLAIGGAGGYLLGQRSSLRGAMTIDPFATDPAGASSPTSPQAAPQTQPSTAPVRPTEIPAEPVLRASPNPPAEAPASAARSNTAKGIPDRPAVGRLTVTSTPAQAEVAIDGVPRGRTPLTLRNLPLGRHTVRVTREGYAPETRRVMLAASSPADSIAFEMASTTRRTSTAGTSRSGESPTSSQASKSRVVVAPPASAAGRGSIHVESRPRGARVTVDGRLVGTTPLVITEVSAGSHRVQIEADRHKPWTTTVDVPPGQRVRVAGSLEEGTPQR